MSNKINKKLSSIHLANGVIAVVLLGFVFFILLIQGIGLSESMDCAVEINAAVNAEVLFGIIFFIVEVLSFINVGVKNKVMTIITIIGCFAAAIIPLASFLIEYFTSKCIIGEKGFYFSSYLVFGCSIIAAVFGILYIRFYKDKNNEI